MSIKGSFGVVHHLKSEPWVVKRVDLTRLDDISRSELYNELGRWERMKCKNILKMMIWFEEGDNVVSLMESCGTSLGDVIGNCLPVKYVMSYTFGIANGLDYLHKKQIVHGHLHPQNVLIQNDTVKLTDFGFRLVRQRNMGKVPPRSRMSGYLAPEGYDFNQEQTTALDIYSLGVLVVEMIAGRVSFEGKSDFEIMNRVCMEDFPYDFGSRGTNEEFSSYVGLARRCVRRDPKERPGASDIVLGSD